MKLDDEITLTVAEAVKKVLAKGKNETEVLTKGEKDFIDAHSVDKKKDPEAEKQVEGKDVEEGNEFTKAAAKAKLAGEDEFEFDGKTYPTEISQDAAEKILGKSESVEELEEAVDNFFGFPTKDKLVKFQLMAKKLKIKPISNPTVLKRGGKEFHVMGFEGSVRDIEKAMKVAADIIKEEKKTEQVEESLDGRTKEFKEKVKKLSYSKEASEEEKEDDLEIDDFDIDKVKISTESTAEYAKSLEKIANDRKMKNISKKDRETLAKIADLLKRANEATGKDGDLKEYVGPALTPANQIAKKFGGKVKAINVKDEKGKKTKMFYAEDEDEIEEAVNFSDVEKVMKWAKKNIKAKKFEIDKKNKIAFIDMGPNNVFMLHTMRRGELYFVHDTRGYSGKSGTAKDWEFTKDNAAEEVIKLISKILGIKEDTLEEAIDPRKFALGGNTKATKRDVDAILSKIFMDTKLAKQVEGSKAYKAGYKAKGKGKNPYKKDTADFHLYILGQQSAQSE